jgi:hypothetical protein
VYIRGVLILDFEIISDRLALERMGITLPEWRSNFVRKTVGDKYKCGGGTMTITFNKGEVRQIKCKNFYKRLDAIIYQLMMPRHKKSDCRWIEDIKAAYGVFDLCDIVKLKIQVIEVTEN